VATVPLLVALSGIGCWGTAGQEIDVVNDCDSALAVDIGLGESVEPGCLTGLEPGDEEELEIVYSASSGSPLLTVQDPDGGSRLEVPVESQSGRDRPTHRIAGNACELVGQQAPCEAVETEHLVFEVAC
jgi:hypothetical protein